MKYLHTMIRVTDLDATLDFSAPIWGLKMSVVLMLRKGDLLWFFSPRPRAGSTNRTDP